MEEVKNESRPERSELYLSGLLKENLE